MKLPTEAFDIALEPTGSIDESGISPCCDAGSSTRDKAFAKISARVAGTALASKRLTGS